MIDLSYNEYLGLLIKILESHRGDRNTQAIYLQSFIQQFGALPYEYDVKVRELME